jgi:hypothetical protein
MKSSALSRSILWAFAATLTLPSDSQAVHLSPVGVGSVLIYPYYTVNAGNQTVFTVVNQTDAGKAVRLRFREARNARTVLEFNLYLSPFDVWTGSVFSLAETGTGNPANLTTSDNSCTVPRLKGNPGLPTLANGQRYVPFYNFNFTGANADAGPRTLSRTREGYFEMIEMGEVINNKNLSLAYITHGASGVPENCIAIERAWWPAGSASSFVTYWTGNALIDMAPPQGGLFGSASIVDALDGTMLGYDADAIEAFSDIPQHHSPVQTLPTLANARTTASTAVAQVFSGNALVTSTYPLSQAIDAVSAVLARDDVFNQFVSSAESGAASEWVLTFPTKFAYTDPAIVGAAATAPFTRTFALGSGAADTAVADVDVKFVILNREEGGGPAPCPDPQNPECLPFPVPIAPYLLPNPKLHWATNVLSFNQPRVAGMGSAVLGSGLGNNIQASMVDVYDGWMTLRLYYPDWVPPGNLVGMQSMRPDQNGGRWAGIPTVGFWAESRQVSQTGGAISKYANASRIRSRNLYQPAR